MEVSPFPLANAELLNVEDCLWLLTAPTGIANYDFLFNAFFRCQQTAPPPDEVAALARLGDIPHYDAVYAALVEDGIRLLHTPDEHRRASELPCWYPLLEDLTPKSLWATGGPDPALVSAELGWPIFMRGARQTSFHRRALSVIEGPDHYQRALLAYAKDTRLRGQGVVCRQYLHLRLVEDVRPERLPSAFEFRTFWWKGQLAACGRYWWDSLAYDLTEREEEVALAVVREAACRLQVPFLVVDIAQTLEGRWLVIECNDGQESGYAGVPSGYAGVPPSELWQKIIAIEREESGTKRCQ